jgi:guanylate kinase/nicotinate (nicotinamide) nucleotide adenylyltransferase
MGKGKLIILSAPSGSGKSTIIRHILAQSMPVEFSVSATSRTPRGNEQEGVEYYFLQPEEFRERIQQGHFIEYEEVYSDCFYGTLKSEVEDKLEQGKNVILDVDVAGGLNIKKQYGDNALLIFIQPPSIEELQARLEKRGTDSAEVIRDRISKAASELKLARLYDKVIINDDLTKAQQETIYTITKFLKNSMRIGIFPGSFNPVHIGHLAIANYLAEYEGYDEIWFLITPQNPLKKKADLLDQNFRLALLEKSIRGYEKFKINTIEWEMSPPTYTVNTLQKLRILHPQHEFVLIIGSDNWSTFHRWKDYQLILKNFKTLIYPRRGSDRIYINHPNVSLCKSAPKIEASSSFIRKAVEDGKDVRFFLPSGIYEEVVEAGFFKSEEITAEAEKDQ